MGGQNQYDVDDAVELILRVGKGTNKHLKGEKCPSKCQFSRVNLVVNLRLGFLFLVSLTAM